MKPSFALNFTDDAIQLLHRMGKGWVLVGETLFSAPDLDEALDYMRKTALGLEPGGFSTKLVIPNSQIRYLEIEAPGPSEEERRAQILAGLEGKTPYPVGDLAFDWSGKGKVVRVAVLAKETLEEAEGFATAHRMNPVSFVAIPEYGDFSGEPWFGATSVSARLLGPGESVERDKTPLRILTRELPVTPRAADDAASAEPAPAPAADPAPEMAAAPAAEDVAVPELAQAAEPASPAEGSAATAAPPVAPSADPPAKSDEAVKTDPEDLVSRAASPTAPAAAAVAIEPEKAPTDLAERAAVPAEEAPFTHVPDNAAFPEEDDTPEPLPPVTAGTAGAQVSAPTVIIPGIPVRPPVAGPADQAAKDDDLPPAPSVAMMGAFASRRATEPEGRAPSLGGAARPDPAALARASRGKPIEDLPPMPRPPQAGGRPAPAAAGGLRGVTGRAIGGLVTAPTIGGGKKAKAKAVAPAPAAAATNPRAALAAAAAAPNPADAAKSLTRPGGTFGNLPPPRQRSRSMLFLSLVAILLLCIALVAAWSTFYLASGTGGDVPSASPAAASEVATADPPAAEAAGDVPSVDDEMLADGQDGLADPAAMGDTAAADPANGTVDLSTADAGAEPVVAEETAVAAADPAPGTAVSSDSPAAAPLAENQDEIFLSESDAPPPALDALSLPSPEAAADALPGPQMPPPPFGTVYAFGEDGLLKPSKAGLLTPGGYMLFAGKPPRVPPSRSEAAAAAAAAALAAVAPPPSGTDLVEAQPIVELDGSGLPAADDVPAEPLSASASAGPDAQPDPDLADRRPRERPADLLPPQDDTGLNTAGDPADTRFARLRPRPRPSAVLAAGEAARQQTEAASLAANADAAAVDPEAEARLAAAAAAEAANPSVVAISRRPEPRPQDFDRAVEAAVAAAIRAPDPPPAEAAEPAPGKKKTAAKDPEIKPEEQSEIDEPEVAAASAAPKIPTKASVAKQATFRNALNLNKVNLIGVYGTPSNRYALIRQTNGKYKKVKVGDRIDGGRIEAITQTEVRYQKGGRLITLAMPKG